MIADDALTRKSQTGCQKGPGKRLTSTTALFQPLHPSLDIQFFSPMVPTATPALCARPSLRGLTGFKTPSC